MHSWDTKLNEFIKEQPGIAFCDMHSHWLKKIEEIAKCAATGMWTPPAEFEQALQGGQFARNYWQYLSVKSTDGASAAEKIKEIISVECGSTLTDLVELFKGFAEFSQCKMENYMPTRDAALDLIIARMNEMFDEAVANPGLESGSVTSVKMLIV
jgi:hypothetical protein